MNKLNTFLEINLSYPNTKSVHAKGFINEIKGIKSNDVTNSKERIFSFRELVAINCIKNGTPCRDLLKKQVD